MAGGLKRRRGGRSLWSGLGGGLTGRLSGRQGRQTRRGDQEQAKSFHRMYGPPRFLGLRAKSGFRPIGYFTPSERIRWSGPLIGRRRQVGKLANRNQAFRIKASAVRSSHKGLRRRSRPRFSTARRRARGAAGGGRLEKLFDGAQTEFLAALFVVALALITPRETRTEPHILPRPWWERRKWRGKRVRAGRPPEVSSVIPLASRSRPGVCPALV